MREPCRSCEWRERDWGGCRCQALAFAGEAAEADPACAKSPLHDAFTQVARDELAAPPPPFLYRNPRAGQLLSPSLKRGDPSAISMLHIRGGNGEIVGQIGELRLIKAPHGLGHSRLRADALAGLVVPERLQGE